MYHLITTSHIGLSITQFLSAPYYQLDFGSSNFWVTKVKFTDRIDCCWNKLHSVNYVKVGDTPTNENELSANPTCGTYWEEYYAGAQHDIICDEPLMGRYLIIQGQKYTGLAQVSINEMTVFGAAAEGGIITTIVFTFSVA